MDKTINMSVLYGIIVLISLALVCGYCSRIRKKEMWLIGLYFSVFVANLGYFALSISKTLEEALLANRLAYLGCVFLPLFMLMTIMKVCKLECNKWLVRILAMVSFVIFLITASQGYLNLYYKKVSLVFVNGMAKLEKVYGPLHNAYYLYLFVYLGVMMGVIAYAVMNHKTESYKQAGILVVVVLLNIIIWLIEQMINWDFEFLSVSYIISELLLLLLYEMIQDYEALQAQAKAININNRTEENEDWLAGQELSVLSAREKEVLKGIIENKKRKEIADELCITENTVKKHISNIFVKLDVTNRKELFDKVQP